jgi:membrane-associated protein
MTVSIPRLQLEQTPLTERQVFLGLAVVRGALSLSAIPLAPWLYREHTAVLVLLRPTKEVFLFAGFHAREGNVFLPVVILAALPILLAGVWLFFGLGRAYRDALDDGELPGIAGRVLPSRRVGQLRDVIERRGLWVVFLGRLAAFPSSLTAAAAGSSGVAWRPFLLADAAGALLSLTLSLSLGYALGEAYEEGGAWVTGLGIVVLVLIAVVVGRALASGSSSRA